MLNVSQQEKVNVESKNLLAKLLATENITVIHQKVNTASFDPKTRVLRLPMFVNMSNDLYDMLVTHEIAHALYSPTDLLPIIKQIDPRPDFLENARLFLNVVEDVRIEKLIKKRYPGNRRVFPLGYKDLINRNFFGTRDRKIESFGFADRINISYKVGSLMTVPFSTKEQEYLAELDQMETIGDCIRLTKKLYQICQMDQLQKKTPPPPPPQSNPLPDMPQRNEGDSDDEPNDEMESSGQDSADEGDEENSDKQESKEDKSETASGDKESDDDSAGDEDGENEDGDSTEGESEEDSDGNEDGDGAEGESEEDSDGEGDSGDEDGETEADDEGAQSPGDSKDDGNKSDEKSEEDAESNSNSSSGAGPGTSVDPEQAKNEKVTPETQDAFNKMAQKLNDPHAKELIYVDVPTADLKQIIVDYKTVHAQIREHYIKNSAMIAAPLYASLANPSLTKYATQYEMGEAVLADFKAKNKNTISFLIQQFELKKAADQLKRSSESKTGKLNTNKLHAYKYADDIFLSVATLKGAKSHGLVIVVDWSSSMTPHIRGTVEQLLNIVMFCRRENIPFEVYSFGVGETYDPSKNKTQIAPPFSNKVGELYFESQFTMRQYFSSKMTVSEFNEACKHMLMLAENFKGYGGNIPPTDLMGGTPLNEAVVATFEIVKQFKARFSSQVVNVVYITDGQGGSGTNVIKDETINYGRHTSIDDGTYQFIIRDKVTRREYKVNEEKYSLMVSSIYRRRRATTKRFYLATAMTDLLIQIMKDRHQVHAVNFYISANKVDQEIFATQALGTEMHGKEFSGLKFKLQHEKSLIMHKEYGWDEFYLILGGSALRTTENDIIIPTNKDASVKDIAAALTRHSRGQIANRIILTRFIDTISLNK